MWPTSRSPTSIRPRTIRRRRRCSTSRSAPSNGATCSGTQRLARNPLTGELLNNTYIGKLVPGTGDFANGMVVVDGTPPQFKNMTLYYPARAPGSRGT